MKITAESTDAITVVDGARTRVWKGRTEGGVECTLFIARVAVHVDEDHEEFRRELETMPPPRELDVRHVLDPRQVL